MTEYEREVLAKLDKITFLLVVIARNALDDPHYGDKDRKSDMGDVFDIRLQLLDSGKNQTAD